MQEEPDLKGILYLNFRKGRNKYMTRYPVPDDLVELYRTPGGKYQKDVTRSITVSGAKAIIDAHHKNISEILSEFEEKRHQGNQSLAKIEQDVKQTVLGEKQLASFEERRKNRKSLGQKLNDELSNIATSSKMSDAKLASILFDWYELEWAKATDRLQYILKLKDEVKGLGVDSSDLVEQLSTIRSEVLIIAKGLDPHFPNNSVSEEIHHVGYMPPHEIQLKQLLVKHRTNLEENCPPYLRMKRLIAGMMVDVLKWQDASYEAGEPKPFTSSSLNEVRDLRKETANQVVTGSSKAPSNKKLISVKELFDKFRVYKKSADNPKDSYWGDLNVAEQLCFEMFKKRSISTLEETDFIKLRDNLLNLPNRKIKKYNGLTLLESIKLADKDKDPLLVNSTVNRYREALVGTLDYAVTNNYLSSHSFNVLRTRFNSRNRHSTRIPDKVIRVHFDDETLSKIFAYPVFTGRKSRDSYTNGTKVYWNYQYWGLLIALFSGMRPREIAQMRASQIKEERGIYYFDNNIAYDDQSLKTEKSNRKIPVHSKLIELGFLDYISKMNPDDLINYGLEKRGKELSPDARIDRLTRWFNRKLLFDLNLNKGNGEVVFYCFRHTFGTKGKRAKIADEVKEMCGWTPKEMQVYKEDMFDNYTSAGYGLENLKEAIEKIQYPSIDFGAINVRGMREARKFVFER